MGGLPPHSGSFGMSGGASLKGCCGAPSLNCLGSVSLSLFVRHLSIASSRRFKFSLGIGIVRSLSGKEIAVDSSWLRVILLWHVLLKELFKRIQLLALNASEVLASAAPRAELAIWPIQRKWLATLKTGSFRIPHKYSIAM
jgi:hypothetical protein